MAQDLAPALRRLADSVERSMKGINLPITKGGMLSDDDSAIGAAIMICYLRDLFTTANREEYRREDILVLLETVARDGDIFPAGIGKIVWDLEVPDTD